jgi:RNA polymerase-binding transcription factor
MDERDGGGVDRVEIRAVLLAHKAELDGEVAELAEPVRAPGVQIQFGKRAGDHTADAVTQMQRSISAGELHHMSVEIDRALAKLDAGTYGICDVCGEQIAQERLEALPWATLCVTCKAAGPTMFAQAP